MGTPTFIVYDTETTGLPPRAPRGAPPIPADDPRQPHLASFAAILTDENGIELDRWKLFVKPNGWTMAECDASAIADGKKPASEIHGLTDDFLNANGSPVWAVLELWNGFIEKGYPVIAFNDLFDAKIMRGELRRAGMPDLFEETKRICAMKALAPYAPDGMDFNLQRGTISLERACEYFGIRNDDAHDSMSDAAAARAIVEILIRDGRLPQPGIPRSKHVNGGK